MLQCFSAAAALLGFAPTTSSSLVSAAFSHINESSGFCCPLLAATISLRQENTDNPRLRQQRPYWMEAEVLRLRDNTEVLSAQSHKVLSTHQIQQPRKDQEKA